MLKLSPKKKSFRRKNCEGNLRILFAILIFFFWSIMFGRKNNSTLQLGVILNNEYNEAIVLENVKRITGMMHTYFFQNFQLFQKKLISA